MKNFSIILLILIVIEVMSLTKVAKKPTTPKTSEQLEVTTPKGEFFETVLDRIVVVKETPNISTWHLKVRKVNKIPAIVGYVTLHQPCGNEFKIQLKALKKQGGEYRYLPYALAPEPICSFAASDVYVYPDFSKQSDFPEDVGDNCPFVAKNYSFHGVTFNFDNVPKAAATSGSYSIEINFYKETTHIATYNIFAFVNKI